MERLNSVFSYDTHYPVINAKNRGISYRFMAAEAAYIISGRNDISYLADVLPGFDRYSDDGYYQTGAYGPQVVDQMPYVISALSEDLYTRQAVMSIWRPSPRKSTDIPCTLTMQFIVTDDENGIPQLNTIANMRSSDQYMGLIYDTFCFAIISSNVAYFAGVDLGQTWINAGSGHIYSKDLGSVAKLVNDPGQIREQASLIPMAPDKTINWLEKAVKADKPLELLLNAPQF